METAVQFCLAGTCILAPVLAAALAGCVYAMGIGAVRFPGIARQDIEPGEDWIAVPDLTRKASDGFAAAISLAGTFFGLIGFLLPWMEVNVGAGAELFNLGALNGTLSGIALAFQPFVAGIGLMSTDISGVRGVGLLLIIVSLIVWPIPIALAGSTLIGLGMISVPLGLLRMQIRRLARALLAVSAIAFCLTCLFFAGIQATVGGVRVGASEGLFGTSISIAVTPANGFWITVGGVLLTLIGAVFATAMAPALENWSKNLSLLRRTTPIEENNGE